MTTETVIKPWYKQFWFWYLMAPLFVVVGVTSTLITVAYKNADDVVIDNYYKEGRMINQVMVQHRRAAELSLLAHLNFDRVTGEVLLNVEGKAELPESLLLLLDHPFEADLDQIVVLHKVSENGYRGELDKPIDHIWYLSLMSEMDKSKRKEAEWILSGRISFTEGESTVLEPLAY